MSDKDEYVMEPVQTTLKKWMQENENFKSHYIKVKQEILDDKHVRAFLLEHPELTQKDIEKNLMKLYEYKIQSKQCDRCTCFQKCQNTIQGYSPILEVNGTDIHLSYEKCHNRIAYEKQKENEQLIQSLYMPKDILEASIEGIDQEDGARKEAMNVLAQFFNAVETTGLPAQGIYFHGAFGVGKTYLLGAVANYLKYKQFSSMLIYMPEFVREMKNSINDGTLNKKIEKFKNVDVLMLDDIGAETQSAWFRDEILGSILQYRMMEQLPVFFTSNFGLEELQTELAVTRGNIEEVKAKRIVERIKQVSRVVRVNGRNRRG